MYLYTHPEKVIYASYITLTKYELKTCEESEVGVPFSFKLTNRTNDKDVHYFYCSDATNLTEWTVQIRKIIETHVQLEVLIAFNNGFSQFPVADNKQKDNSILVENNNNNNS